ncbi:hypothetical protein LSM04_002554 [Trypanosoma melophagium]|uniref:uncharacterized protein n=1 Tax=Trypanosoma melophagium TaxID=715481 RepID=UPI00351A0232|nr:hypothetical protein LSM04_002554 [Trypanosoma melophagium]
MQEPHAHTHAHATPNAAPTGDAGENGRPCLTLHPSATGIRKYNFSLLCLELAKPMGTAGILNHYPLLPKAALQGAPRNVGKVGKEIFV